MIPVQVADGNGRRILARNEDLSRAERAVAVAKENGGIAIIADAGVPRTNHEQIGFAVAVEITYRDSSRVFPCGEVRRWLEGSVTIPQQNTHASVVAYAWVAKANHRKVRFAVVVKVGDGSDSGAVRGSLRWQILRLRLPSVQGQSISNVAAKNLIFASMMKLLSRGLFGYSKELAAGSRCPDIPQRSPAASARPSTDSPIFQGTAF
jgi:hypothetical protein